MAISYAIPQKVNSIISCPEINANLLWPHALKVTPAPFSECAYLVTSTDKKDFCNQIKHRLSKHFQQPLTGWNCQWRTKSAQYPYFFRFLQFNN